MPPDAMRSYDPGPYTVRCAWCDRLIPDQQPCCGVGARAKPGTDLREHEGRVLLMVISNKSVPALVTRADSQARKDGRDFMFLTCSEQCGQALKASFQEQQQSAQAIQPVEED